MEDFCQSGITLNPWQNGTIGYDTAFADAINKEYHDLSSPLIYARIVNRKINLENIELNGFSEYDYLKDKEQLDELYEEGERAILPGKYAVNGVFELPLWAQELGKYGIAEQEELTVNFNVSKLTGQLDGSVIHIGDLLMIHTTIYGWKYYEIMNAVPSGNFLGQYLMWQVVAKKTDLEGYTELENANIEHHDSDSPTEEDKPRPRVY